MGKEPIPEEARGEGWIRIRGAREHNLRGIDLDIPRRRLTVVTGVSGSGKSSLALDTLYAEGQRRYLEGVSTQARRLLERLPRPEVDSLEGISPAIAVRQRSATHGARSTVGTATEIHDYLRLLFARVGRVVCPACDLEVPRWTIESLRDLWSSGPRRRLLVAFPHPTGKDPGAAIQGLQARGYRRVVVKGEAVDPAEAGAAASWDVLQDRLTSDRADRLAEALEAAFREGGGEASVHPEGGPPLRHRLGRVCAGCGTAYPDPEPLQFSFNSPGGACPQCEGFGYRLKFDPLRIVPDPSRSIDEGAVEPWAGRWRSYFLRKLEASPRARAIPRRKPWCELEEEDRELLLHGGAGFPGVMRFLERLSARSYKAGARFLVKRYQSAVLCSACGGSRLREEARRVRVDGESLPEWCALAVRELRVRLGAIHLDEREREIARPLLEEIVHRLDLLERVGLGYLALDRTSRSLSGGEAQRIELAQALGARLVDALYLLDEPTVGLHPRDTQRLIEVLRDLIRPGNTVVVVEHDRDLLLASDWMIDLGPGGGRNGGELIYCGETGLRGEGPPSPTVDVLLDRARPARAPLAEPRGWLRVREARLHNLKGVDADLPWGVLVGVCGVSGSGKSSLVTDSLVPLLEARMRSRVPLRGETAVEGLGRLVVEAPIAGLGLVDQNPLPRSTRSVPASYMGAWDGIRKLFAALPEARRRGLKPGAFSFNLAGGRCEACRGEGEVTLDMDFLPDLRLPCETCGGSRFGPAVAGVRLRGLDIADILALSVDRAVALFAGTPSVVRPLWWLGRVGLGYLALGQPASTLSGGEAQRLKLARELSAGAGGRLLVLDEPTVGLHGVEVTLLAGVLRDLVKAGNGVLVVEHHVDILAACDWLLELGPEGGDAGGELLAQGPPEVVARSPRSRIGPYLEPLLRRGRSPAGSV